MSEGTMQIADQMHGWIDGSALLHHDTVPFVTSNLFGNQPPRHGCQHGFGDFIQRLLLADGIVQCGVSGLISNGCVVFEKA